MFQNLQLPLILRRVDRNSLVIIILFFLGSLFLLKPRIGGDGFSYYAWLRSPVIDHNFDFTNEYNEFNTGDYWTAKDEITDANLPANPFAIGPAILWAPWFALAYLLTSVSGKALGLVNDGYSFYYQILIPLGSLVYAMIGALYLHKILLQFFKRHIALLTTLGIVFGSMLLNYLFNEPASSHPLSFFIITIFYWRWLATHKFETTADSYLGGLLAGLMCLVRWQHAIFLLPVFVFMAIKEKRYFDFFVFCIAALMIFSVQFVAWKIVYGHFFYLPQGIGYFIPPTHIGTWLGRIPLLLFSANHGLFYWTPLMLLAFLGSLLFIAEDRWLGLSFLATILLSIMVNSWVWEYYGGWAFGARRLTEILPFLAIGLGCLWSAIAKINWAKNITLALIGWNILLWLEFVGKAIEPTGALRFPQWLWGQIVAVKYLYLALGHSGVLSYLYLGFTGDAQNFAFSLLAATIYTFVFILLISLFAYTERKENFL